MPAQSQNTAPIVTQAGQMRLEPLPLGDSQVHPDFNHYRPPEVLTPIEDSTFDSAVTVLSMSLQRERLLAHEKRRNYTLTVWVSSLQDQLQQAEMSYKALKQDYDHLCNGGYGNSQLGWGPEDAQKSPIIPTGPSDALTTNKMTNSMPPPAVKEEISQRIKRKGENMGGPTKRMGIRTRAVDSYGQQLSPKSLFNPPTPTTMSF